MMRSSIEDLYLMQSFTHWLELDAHFRGLSVKPTRLYTALIELITAIHEQVDTTGA
jgi:hypothetical protein